jgi:hypothetical protein
MKKLISNIFLAAAIATLSFSMANAAAPVQFSFFDFNAPKASEVEGVRFPAIYGKGGGNITGLEINLLAYSEMESFKGFQLPIIAGIGANRITGDMTGVSWSLFNWHEGQDTGWNAGVVNMTANVKGVNTGVVNYSTGHTIVDLAYGVNISKSSNFQLSFVNVTQEINGVQIGLINCAKNGFLKCFVIFNFGSAK